MAVLKKHGTALRAIFYMNKAGITGILRQIIIIGQGCEEKAAAYARRAAASSSHTAQSDEKEMRTMSYNSSNQLVNPSAREAMDRFKMEAASEVGVNLKNGYNGDLTSRQAGSVGGQMVKKMIQAYENGMK